MASKISEGKESRELFEYCIPVTTETCALIVSVSENEISPIARQQATIMEVSNTNLLCGIEYEV